MEFKFSKKQTTNCINGVNSKLTKIVERIAPSPFPIDSKKVVKKITVTVDNDGKEIIAESIKEQITMGKFCIVLNCFEELCPLWFKLNHNSLIVASYVRHKMELKTNAVELIEKEFCQYSGLGRDCYYKGLSVLLRPASPNIVAGDSLALLSATTKRNIYIVNHNLLFKGNYDEFITILTAKYPDGCKLDNKGRVILD